MTAPRIEAALHDPVGKLLRWLPGIALAIALTLIAFYSIVFRALPLTEHPDAWGQFGDYMGGLLNPLISLFTLIVAISVWQLQKTELLETRKALEEQGKTAAQQRREQRFFDVLRLYQETLRSVEFERAVEAGVRSYSGKSAFQYIANTKFRTSAGGNLPNNIPLLLLEKAPIDEADIEKFAVAMEQWAALLDHYFRVIFLLLREAEPTLGVEHFRYVKYLRAQLSKDELLLLAINMLFDPEGKLMIPWATSYGLLKHLPPGRLRTFAEEKLPAKVFGEQWAAKQLEGSECAN